MFRSSGIITTSSYDLMLGRALGLLVQVDVIRATMNVDGVRIVARCQMPEMSAMRDVKSIATGREDGGNQGLR